MKIPVAVDGSRLMLPYHFRLRRFGLRRVAKRQYRGRVRERRMERLRDYCREKHLKFYTDNAYGTRDGAYRARFFQNHPPLPGGFYFCAYCGRLVSKRKVTVDHLYPVAMVSRDPKLQKKLRRQGITDLNCAKNLVPACYDCNQKKAANMGDWIRKGKIGRHAWVWMLRHVLRLCLLALVLYGLYETGVIHLIWKGVKT
jgi:5-methylcytosine-specific restriction endonuclease McrA